MDIILSIIGIILLIVASIIRAFYLMNMSVPPVERGHAFGGAGPLFIPIVSIIIALIGSVFILISTDYIVAIFSLIIYWYAAHLIMYLIIMFYA